MKSRKHIQLALLFLVAGITSPSEAVVLLAKDVGLSALTDPGRIAGDGSETTTTPGWEIVVNDSDHPAVPLGNEVVRLATDLASDGRQRARGIVQFDLGLIADGSYDFSLLIRTANIRQSNLGAERNQTFAVRLVVTGEAVLNGVQGNVSPWLIVSPLLDDKEGQGQRGPWFPLVLAGASGTPSDYAIHELDDTWDFSAPITLGNVNGTTGRFVLEVLDGVGANFSSIYVAQLMLTKPGTGASALGLHSPPAAATTETVCVALLGGSSVRTSYLPEELQHDVVLERELAVAYPDQKIEVVNLADNGEYIARYFLRGAYERQRRTLQGMDIAIIRFGTNDQKFMDSQEYRRHLEKLIETLQTDFPGVRIVLETGIYLDYPLHYSFDRNAVLNPFWQVSRDIAEETAFPLVDYYEAVKRETKVGNWDVRVRKNEGNDVFVLDASQDAGRENDPSWFTDVHPNPEGVRLAVREEVEQLKANFPERLPTGQKSQALASRSASWYADYLDFSPERMSQKRVSTPVDQLQGAIQ